jgi:hypothetical protein
LFRMPSRNCFLSFFSNFLRTTRFLHSCICQPAEDCEYYVCFNHLRDYLEAPSEYIIDKFQKQKVILEACIINLPESTDSTL